MARPWNFGWPLGPARGGIAASRRGNAGLERQRHVGDGNEPSRQAFRADLRRSRKRSARAAEPAGRLRRHVHAGRRFRGKRHCSHESHGTPRHAGRGLRRHGPLVQAFARRSRALRQRPHRRQQRPGDAAGRPRAGPVHLRPPPIPGRCARNPPICTCAATRPSAAWNSSTGPTRPRWARPMCRWSWMRPRISCRVRWTSRAAAWCTPARRRTPARPA